MAAIQNAVVWVDDHDLDLRVVGSAATILTWNAVPGATGYDVIRIIPGAVFQDPSFVHLGTVACWENDSADTTTGAGTEPANPDTDPLSVGQAFFYLVRAVSGPSNLTYGFTGACSRERIADAGDCP